MDSYNGESVFSMKGAVNITHTHTQTIYIYIYITWVNIMLAITKHLPYKTCFS